MKKIISIIVVLILLSGCMFAEKHTEVDGVWKSQVGTLVLTIKYPYVENNVYKGKISLQDNGEYKIVFDIGNGFTKTYYFEKLNDKEANYFSEENRDAPHAPLKKFSD